MNLRKDLIEPLSDEMRDDAPGSIWARIQREARIAVRDEPLLGALIHAGLLHHATFDAALAYRFSLKLASREMSEQILRNCRARLWPICWRSMTAIRRRIA
jgi:serine O-acetyltransferase